MSINYLSWLPEAIKKSMMLINRHCEILPSWVYGRTLKTGKSAQAEGFPGWNMEVCV